MSMVTSRSSIIARGAALLFMPLLGFMVFGERLDAVGVIAMVAILAGVLVLQLATLRVNAMRDLGQSLMASRATMFALFAAAATAGYTVWDKHAVLTLAPFSYLYAYTALVGLAYGAFIVRRYETAAIRTEWREKRWAILQVAFFNTVTYVLVLFALRGGVSSYVIAIRQLSIAFGVLLGWRLLGETVGPPKRLGVALIVGGTMLVALTR